MDISSLLKVILLKEKAKGHEAVLNEMTGRLIGKPYTPADKVICDLKDHESMEGVLAGTGSAVFHCLSEEVPETVIALTVSKRPVPDPKLRPVNIFFLIISPIKESGTHLQLLSKLEGLLMDAGFRHALLRAANGDEVKRELKKVEGSARSFYIPLSKKELFSELETSEQGLGDDEAARRLRLTGPNSLKKIAKGTLLKDFLHNLFLNLFAVLLWAGGAMAFIANTPELGLAIFSVIIINAVFSFWQEYKAESAVEALKKLLPRKVRALRGGKEKEIDADALVPGDLIRLSEGDAVPADGRLVEAQEMRVDNSPLTGESKPIYKISEPVADGKGFIWTEVPNLVFAGTMVVSGSGIIVVTATGMDTEIGRVAYLTQAIKPETSPLQKEIKNLTKTITVIAVLLGAVFSFIGYAAAGLTFAESFIFAIGIIVANVPEGLLPTVSLSLAMAVERMAGKKAIVKKLSAVETLGSATVICTDKTGTLTTNQMCVSRLFIDGKLIEVTGTGYAPEGEFLLNGKALSREELGREGVLDLLAAAALCNNAGIRKESGSWEVSGDPTEAALLTAAEKAGVAVDGLKACAPRVAHLPFERIRKRMSTVNKVKKDLAGVSLLRNPGRTVAFVKGSPEEIVFLCTGVYRGGQTLKITDDDRKAVIAEYDRMASEGLRILAAAVREIDERKTYKAEEVEGGLALIGLTAMLDPPRPEVRKAVAECRSAGIKIVMVTGDYGLTAKAVASRIGLDGGARLLTGEDLNCMSHRELRDILKKEEVIFARVAPKDKLRVVTALQDNGEIVAVTGDGVNDAPALKKADIGIAMGLRGSDVAKESAEIVLADDNFASIVDAVREGRAVYANIKKFITYILTHNVAELVPVIAYMVLRIPLPLKVMQMLAIDLGSDIFPSLGLGVEPPEKGIMTQKPRPREERLLDLKTLARTYLFLGPLEAAFCLAAFFFAYWLRGWQPGTALEPSGAVYMAATTMTFAGIVTSQMGNVFACRTERDPVLSVGFFKNRLVLLSLLIEAGIMLALIYTPALSGVFGFAPLTLKDWTFIAAFPLLMFGMDEIRKAFARRRDAVKKS